MYSSELKWNYIPTAPSVWRYGGFDYEAGPIALAGGPIVINTLVITLTETSHIKIVASCRAGGMAAAQAEFSILRDGGALITRGIADSGTAPTHTPYLDWVDENLVAGAYSYTFTGNDLAGTTNAISSTLIIDIAKA